MPTGTSGSWGKDMRLSALDIRRSKITVIQGRRQIWKHCWDIILDPLGFLVSAISLNYWLKQDLSQDASESLFSVVKLRVDPDHADQVEDLGQYWRNVSGVSVGEHKARLFENRQELEVALCLVRAVLDHTQQASDTNSTYHFTTLTRQQNRLQRLHYHVCQLSTCELCSLTYGLANVIKLSSALHLASCTLISRLILALHMTLQLLPNLALYKCT